MGDMASRHETPSGSAWDADDQDDAKRPFSA
jgi:hypothetical protein